MPSKPLVPTVPCRVCGKAAVHKTLLLCHTHREKLRLTGTLEYRKYPKVCSRPGCDMGGPIAKGLCHKHYVKFRNSGTFERLRSSRRLGWTRSDFHRYSRYGVTRDEFLEQLETQQNACSVCKQPFKRQRDMHQDHNHSTGQVRGILCRECNLVLGSVEARGIPPSFYTDYLDDWALYAEGDEEESA
jgi:hypothetical protein